MASVLAAGQPPPAEATNTSEEAELRVTLHDGTILDGRIHFERAQLVVRGRHTRRVPWSDVSTLGLVPPPARGELERELEHRRSRLPPDDVRGWAELGRWAREQDLVEAARDAFEHVLELDPTHAGAHHGLGRIEDPGAASGWSDAGAFFAARRASIAPGDLDGLLALARLALESEQEEHGFAILRDVLRRDAFHAAAIELVRPLASRYRHRVELTLPVRGRWLAGEDATRHHQKKSYALHALDLVKVDDEGRAHRGRGRRIEEHYAWDAPFYAAAPGTVVEVRDGHPDNAIGGAGGRYDQHNGVSIDHGNGELSWYLHARQGSIVVKRGDRVERGQLLGRVGNSGGSAAPHLHFTLVAYGGISVPWACDGFAVIAPDGTPIHATRAWPREGWTLVAGDGE